MDMENMFCELNSDRRNLKGGRFLLSGRSETITIWRAGAGSVGRQPRQVNASRART